MKVKITKPIELKDGVHDGEISRYEDRTEPYAYIDVYVKVKDDHGKPVEIKEGFAASLSSGTALGKFLSRFGVDVKKISDGKEELDIDSVLPKVGTKVTFQSMMKAGKQQGQMFATIVEESLKPKQ